MSQDATKADAASATTLAGEPGHAGAQTDGRRGRIRRRADTSERSVLPVIAGGVLTASGTLVAASSFAVLIFAGQLSPYLSRGIGIALFTAVVAGVLVSVLSSCARSIAIPQDRVAPVLALMSAQIVAALPASFTPQDAFVTVATAIALASLLTGLFLLVLGLFRVGELIRFLPHSVLGGFLAGTGWLLLIGGLRVMTSSPLSGIADAMQLIQPPQLIKWLPGIGLAALMLAAVNRYRHAVALSLALILSTAAFYVIALAAGLPLAALEQEGWLLGPLEVHSQALWTPLPVSDVVRADWAAIAANVGSLGTVMLLSAVSVLLTVSALEGLTGRELDVNRELQVAGVANLTSAIGGGMVAFHSLSFSKLAVTLGTRSRAMGLISALTCAAALWSGPELFGYLPRLVLGGFLAYLGLSFLAEWLVGGWSRLPRSEYAIVLLILFTMAAFGFLIGMTAGLIAAITLFVVNYSRIDVVRYAVSGGRRASTVERHPLAERFVRDRGDWIQIFQLQGYLFFGTARKLQRSFEARVTDPDLPRLRFAVLDFRQVTGIDPSTVHVFAKIRNIARQSDVGLVLTQLDGRLRRRLGAGDGPRPSVPDLLLFPDLDHGLEWCEEQILKEFDQGSLTADATILKQISDRLTTPDQRTAFAGYLERLEVPAGHTLARQGAPSDGLYFVETGTVSVYLETDDGSRVRLRRTGPGTVIGELGFYLGVPRSAWVTTDTAATIYRLSADGLSRMEREQPVLAVVLHRFMAEFSADRLQRTTRLVAALSI